MGVKSVAGGLCNEMLRKSTALTYYFYQKPHNTTLLRATVVTTRRMQASNKKTRVEFNRNEKHCLTLGHTNGYIIISYYSTLTESEFLLLLFWVFPSAASPHWSSSPLLLPHTESWIREIVQE